MPISAEQSSRAARTGEPTKPVASLLTLPEVRLGVGCAGLLATTAVCVGLHVPSGAAALVLVGETGVASTFLRGPAALAWLLGVTGWALCTGFVVNELGDLTFRPTDLARLGVYVLVALTCRWVGRHNDGVRVEEAGCGEARSAHSVVPGGTGSRWSPRC